MMLLPEPAGPSKKHHLEKLLRNPILWCAILIVEVLFYSCYAIFVNLSRYEDQLEYSSASMVVNIEVLKFVFAMCVVGPQLASSGIPRVKMKSILPFAVPATCYCFNNNLAVHMQDQMDPATFQVLCNLKIASTAILYRMIMKRRLQKLQWFSLVLLAFAGGINSYSGLSKTTSSLREIHLTVLGLFMSILYCTISGFSGVYTEYILKRDFKISLPLQNCFLYSFGILLNLLLWIFQADAANSFYKGYNFYTWATIISQALNGLVMSLIMKHSSNIVRLFIISSAIPVTTVLSMIIFELQPDFIFFGVVVLVIAAIYLYNVSAK